VVIWSAALAVRDPQTHAGVLEASILDLPRIYLNGGKRGFLVGLAPAEVQRLLQPTLVQVAIEE